MIKNILKSFILIGFSLCLLCIICKSTWAAPSIKFDQTSFDFGEVVQGKSVSHTFKFKNIGDAPLTINKVRAG